MTLALEAVAPDFALREQHGETFRLSEQRGVRAVAVVFYPFAFSDVCSGELAGIQRRLSELRTGTSSVVAVSCDPLFTLRAFADRDGLGFPLLSDFWPHGEVARAYDVLDETRGCARRSSFVVDTEGLVRWSVHSPMPDARDLDDLVVALHEAG